MVAKTWTIVLLAVAPAACGFDPVIPEAQICELGTDRCAPGYGCMNGVCRAGAEIRADVAESMATCDPSDEVCPKLLELDFSEGQLSPKFQSTIDDYELSLSHEVTQITLSPTVSMGAAAWINDTRVSTNGTWSKSIRDIGAASSEVIIDVVAGHEHRTYRVSVTPTIPAWAVDGGFDEYAAWLEMELNGARARFRWAPAGTFRMGSPESEIDRYDNEGPQHEVQLSEGFWIADTECTQALWVAVMGHSPRGFGFPRPEKPAESVTWYEVQGFLATASRDFGQDLRLPTEAQWEYACRARSQDSRYGPIGDVAWYDGNSDQNEQEIRAPHPVASLRPNDFGLYDTLGNVHEWCEDWFGPYNANSPLDPTGPETGTKRVARGGSWFDPARDVRAAYRANWIAPEKHGGGTLGFRFIRPP